MTVYRFVILASDGLWDYLSDQEAVEIVASCMPPRSSAANSSDTTGTYLFLRLLDCYHIDGILIIFLYTQRRQLRSLEAGTHLSWAPHLPAPTATLIMM